MPQKIVPLILSGGSGTRLWPLSRSSFPKQFQNFTGGEASLFQETVIRSSSVTNEPPIVICNVEHRFLVAEQLREIGVEGATIILEPAGRNTAPAVAVAALARPDDILFVQPSDQRITDQKAFKKAVLQGVKRADDGKLVTFGIVPDHPHTGYGYIHAGADTADGAFAIDAFVEKPDQARAKKLLEKGCYWNGGIFLLPSEVYLDELQTHAPEMLTCTKAAFDGAFEDLDFLRLNDEAFCKCPSNSIDYAVMEHTAFGEVVPLDAGWSDLGSWTAVRDQFKPDALGNVTTGDVLVHDTHGTYVQATSRLVATAHVKDLMIVETPDAVLITGADGDQSVKEIVRLLGNHDRGETVFTHRVYRPWGWYEGIDKGKSHQVKRIQVKPGEKLSLQMHHHRSEHWVVVHGVAHVTRGDEVIVLEENQSTFIPKETKHALENRSDKPLEIIEVQSGDYLGEDDIVRFDDRYNRS